MAAYEKVLWPLNQNPKMKVTLVLLISVITALGYVEHIHVSGEFSLEKSDHSRMTKTATEQ